LFYDDKFGEITPNKDHYAVQGHSRSPLLVQIDFLLVINTNVRHMLHRFRDIAFICEKSLYLTTSLVFNTPGGGVSLGQSP